MELRQYWLILWSHRRMIGILTASAAIVALAMTYILSPTYISTATVLIRPQSPGVLEDRIVQKEAMGFPINLNPVKTVPESYAKIIQGRNLAEKIVDRMGAEALVDPKPQNILKRAYKWVKDTAKATLYYAWMLLKHGFIAKQEPRDAVIDKVMNAIKAEAVEDTYLVNITVKLPDPLLAAAVANAAAEEFVKLQREMHEEELAQLQAYLGKKLEQLRAEHGDLYTKMKDYKEKEQFALLEAEAGMKLSRMNNAEGLKFDVEKELIGLKVQQGKIEAQLAALPKEVTTSKTEQENPVVQSLKQIASNAEVELAGLLKLYTEEHPAVIATRAKIEDARKKLSELEATSLKETKREENPTYQRLSESLLQVKQKIAANEAQLGRINEEIAELQAEVAPMNENERQMKAFDIKVRTMDAVVYHLMKAYEDTKLQEGENFGEIRVIHPASPMLYPKGPVKIFYVGMAAGLALVVGAALAFLLEYLNLRVRTIAEAEKSFGLPVLATLPLVADDAPLGARAST